jgi:hypothetical protein
MLVKQALRQSWFGEAQINRNRPDLWANPLQPNKLKDLRILNRILDLKTI